MHPPSQHRWHIQPWMTGAALARVLRALGAPQVDVRFVGGAVRNAVMGLAVSEIDLATPEIPTRVIARLADAGLKTVPTGLDHGTVMALADGVSFEITTLRRDTACDGRHAVVEYTTDWHEDARRRDFTMNAMSLRPDGTLFDDHDGLEDAKAGRVRFVGDAADRIREDYLRILRMFRFFGWYGRAPLEPAALAACRSEAGGLARLSGERIHQELAKLLSAPSPVAAVKAMVEAGVLAHVLPAPANVAALINLVNLEPQVPSPRPDWLRRMAAMLPPGTADDVADRLKLSNTDRARLTALTAPEPVLDDRVAPLVLHRALYRLGAPLVADRLLLAWAHRSESADPAPWHGMLATVAAWMPKSLPVGGEDVLALGIKPGPTVGRLLAAIEAWWIGAGFAPDRAQTLVQLKHLTDQVSDGKKNDGSGGVPEPSAL